MMLTTKGRYAVMAMVDMACQPEGKPVTLADIAERQNITLAYLEQIFAMLKKNGLVKSVRGPGGGYLLARPQQETWISDIIVGVEESLQITRCSTASAKGCMHDKTRCLTHDLWEGLGNHIYNYLRSISLQDVRDRKIKILFPLPPSEHGLFPGYLQQGGTGEETYVAN